MDSTHSRCLLLNADYTPLSIIGWKKAMIWSVKYNSDSRYAIEIIDFYKNDYIRGVNDRKFPIPAVAKTCKYFKINTHKITFSRKNIFLRDDYTCQYCGCKFHENELTYDHVVPKSCWKTSNRSSATNWTNIVTACMNCNRKKSNRTPKQANMSLKNLPVAPIKSSKYLPITHFIRRIRTEIPYEWITYLPESYIE